MVEQTPMHIRKYTDTDREAIVAMWQSVFPNDPPHNAPSLVLDEKLNVDDLIFVIEDNHRIVGGCLAGYDGHRGWLYTVAVEAGYRRKGAGSRLVKTAVKELKSIGCKKVNIQIRATNTVVAEFYKSLGFHVEDRLSMGLHI